MLDHQFANRRPFRWAAIIFAVLFTLGLVAAAFDDGNGRMRIILGGAIGSFLGAFIPLGCTLAANSRLATWSLRLVVVQMFVMLVFWVLIMGSVEPERFHLSKNLFLAMLWALSTVSIVTLGTLVLWASWGWIMFIRTRNTRVQNETIDDAYPPMPPGETAR